jgi:hypothetical protein
MSEKAVSQPMGRDMERLQFTVSTTQTRDTQQWFLQKAKNEAYFPYVFMRLGFPVTCV